jgi:4-amino-4-deoxy-L-arabinose transferase-like glycosyltransferase
MAHPHSRSSPPARIALGPIGLSALFAAALTLWATAPHGPGLDSDSAQYLSAARSVASGQGWIAVDGAPYTLWPPLFPSLIGAFERLGATRESTVRGLHALAAFVVVAGAGSLVLRVTRSALASILCAAALLVSPALFSNLVMAWSEPLFLALSIATLHVWLSYDEQPTRGRFAALCALSAAALLQRYLGVTLIASIAVLLALGTASESFARKARRGLAYVALSIAPAIAWFARNALVSGGFDGKRGPAVGDVAKDTARALELVSRWLSGYFQSPARFALVAVALALIALGVFRGEGRASQRRAPAWLACVYLGAVIALRQLVEFDELDERLLAPLIPLVWASIAIGVAALVQSAPSPRRTLALVAALAWFVLSTCGAVVELHARVRGCRDTGAGLYETARWQTSPTSAWLRAHGDAPRRLTNEPFALFCTTDARATPLPARPMGFTKLHERLPADTDEFEVAWFTLNQRAVFPTAVLAAHFEVERTHAFDDGEIYVLRRK